MRNKFKIKSPYPLKQEGEIRTMSDFEVQQLGGSPSGMFMIPMGIYNRLSDANEKFNQRQMQQQQIKLNKEGFNSMEDKKKK